LGRAAAATVMFVVAVAISAKAPAAPDAGPTTSTALHVGDVAITGFSGTTLASDALPAGVDPVDRTLIDPNGPALRIFDASNLGAAPAGKVVNAPVRLDVPAKDIGQVFSLAFDQGDNGGPPNLYAAAT
jgi:hypothetical protein